MPPVCAFCRLLLPYERYLRGEHSKPLPAPYQKPAYRQLISNIANNGIADGSPPEDLKIGKMDEKLKVSILFYQC